MRLSRYSFLFTALLCGAALPACSGGELANTEVLSTSTPIAVAQSATEPPPTPTVEPTATPSGPDEIEVWLPDVLMPVENDDAASVLARQTDEFVLAQGNVVISFRRKSVSGVGGIMPTLRTASSVAPGALPDLTLIRRENLLIAARAGLIQPLEGEIATAILGNLYDSALQLGQVDGRLYGVPYTLEVQHIIYDSDQIEDTRWSFSEMLAQDVPFIFPAGRATGLNDVFLVQYVNAGGEIMTDGTLAVDADALRDTLQFYEAAVERGIITPRVLEYSAPTDYPTVIEAGDFGAALVTSSLYLDLVARGITHGFGAIPTESGEPGTILNGWMWVVTTTDAEQQALAINYLNWMMDPGRQSLYSETVHQLPSQRTALLRWDNAAYADFIDTLLNNAVLPISESSAGTVANALQAALNGVLTGIRDADEAAQDVVQQLGTPQP